jgi:hypothetical protein
VEILGVVNVVPVANSTPPVDTSYQFIVPAVAVASKLRVPGSQRELGVVEDIVGVMVTVAVTAVRVMLLQAAVLASA